MEHGFADPAGDDQVGVLQDGDVFAGGGTETPARRASSLVVQGPAATASRDGGSVRPSSAASDGRAVAVEGLPRETRRHGNGDQIDQPRNLTASTKPGAIQPGI